MFTEGLKSIQVNFFVEWFTMRFSPVSVWLSCSLLVFEFGNYMKKNEKNAFVEYISFRKYLPITP